MNRDFWHELYYIELMPGRKMPAGPWGGYDQDFDEAENVKTSRELTPGCRYGYIAHGEHDLGVIDLDFYKTDDWSPEDVRTGRELTVVKSPSGGYHVPFLVPSGTVARLKSEAESDEGPDEMLRVADGFSDWVDVKGEVSGGHCVAPFGTEYELGDGSADYPPVLNDASAGELRSLLNIGGEQVIETERRSSYDGLEARPPGDVAQLLGGEYEAGRRHEHPYHSSSSGSNFYVFPDDEFWYCYRHECGGTLLHLLGMEYGVYECGDWVRMDETERAQLHRTIRARAEWNGVDIERNGRKWACTAGEALDDYLEEGRA